MSVRIPRWFGVPPALFESGLVARMSESDLRLCVFLFYRSDRCSSRRFEAKDRDITRDAGVSQRALRDARKHLVTLQVIVIEREAGGCFVYTLCDPKTGRPYPGDPKAPLKYAGGESKADPPQPGWTYNTEAEVPTMADDEVSFDFGHNVSLSALDVKKYSPFE